jgi:hypothetical protein
MHRFIVLFLAVAITGCASSRGFDRGNLRTQINDQKVITDDDIKNTLELKPQLPAPFKLAIYFAPPKSDRRYERSWIWKGEDKEILLQIGAELKGKKIISDVFIVVDTTLEGDDKAIRLAAARAGADAVLIVNGVGSIDRYNNAYGVTYVLLVTPFFVPGTIADGLVMMNASMWDVRNEYLYMTAEAEGSATQTRPAFFVNETHLINVAKSSALAFLKKEITTRLINMNSKK